MISNKNKGVIGVSSPPRHPIPILILALLTGCSQAPTRYLTEQEDAKVGRACAEGCMIVPASMVPALMEVLRGGRI